MAYKGRKGIKSHEKLSKEEVGEMGGKKMTDLSRERRTRQKSQN